MRSVFPPTSSQTFAWIALASRLSSSPIFCASAFFPVPAPALISSSKNHSPDLVIETKLPRAVSFRPHVFSFAFSPSARRVTLFIVGGPHDELQFAPHSLGIRGISSLFHFWIRVRARPEKRFWGRRRTSARQGEIFF